MKHWQIALSIFAALSVSLALAEDFKAINGKEYKDATITRVEGDGIVLRTKTGISKVYFVELPQDVQKKFRPSPPTPTATQSEPIKVEAKQDGHQQGDRGGRVVVVGQSGVSGNSSLAGSLSWLSWCWLSFVVVSNNKQLREQSLTEKWGMITHNLTKAC